MTIRGQITRLPFSTGNTALPTLVNYDYTDALADILAWPTLRAFFDFSDRTTMTESGGEVVSVIDLTGNFQATAASGARGVYGATVMNGQPGLTCAGSQKYVVPSLYPSSTVLTEAAAVLATDPTSTSRVFLSDASDGNVNFYTLGDQIRFMSGDVALNVPSLRNRTVNIIATANFAADTCQLYSDGLSASGTTIRAAPNGDGNIASWNDANTGGKFVGSLGYVALFTEDASQNVALRNLLDDYALRRWRLG